MNPIKPLLYVILLSLVVSIAAQESLIDWTDNHSIKKQIVTFNDRAEGLDINRVAQRFYYSFRALELLNEFTPDTLEGLDKSFNPRYEEARSRLQLGFLAANAPSAIAQFEQVVELQADTRLTMQALRNLAIRYQELEQFTQARSSLDAALNLPLTEAQRLAIFLQSSQVLRASGAFILAQGKAMEALTYAQSNDSLSAAQVLLELGAIAWANNETAQAQTFWQRAEEQALMNDEGLLVGEALYWQARGSQRTQNSEEALFFAQKAALFLTAEERTNLFADVQQLLAELYKEQGNVTQAFTLLQLMYETRVRLLHRHISSVSIIDSAFFESGELRTEVNMSRSTVRTQQKIIWIQMTVLVALIAFVFFLTRRLGVSETNQQVTEQSYYNLAKRLEKPLVSPHHRIATLASLGQPFALLSCQLTNLQTIRTQYGSLATERALSVVSQQFQQLFLQLEELNYDDKSQRLNFLSSALLADDFLATIVQISPTLSFVWQGEPILVELATNFFVFNDANDTQGLEAWLTEVWG